MRRIGAKGGTAGVPSEMVQFVSDVWQVELTDDFSVRCGGGIDVDDE
jgi:hypothetical protein